MYNCSHCGKEFKRKPKSLVYCWCSACTGSSPMVKLCRKCTYSDSDTTRYRCIRFINNNNKYYIDEIWAGVVNPIPKLATTLESINTRYNTIVDEESIRMSILDSNELNFGS
jgi:hypothetical protein